MLNFSNSYAQLGNAFYQQVLPTPVAKPELLLWNNALAEQLLITAPLSTDRDLQAQVFSGNQLPEGAEAIALAYSGHQFGQLSPQLGDGRAHLLGEVVDSNGQRRDIQLKGSGPTAFSRGGDGRCALGPALREYIMSEAMYFLGVPTSRCLAVVSSGEQVFREGPKPGAVVTRVAASHIRVGTFVYFASRGDKESLKTLLDYTVNRHFAEIESTAENTADKALQFLQAVVARQITLVVEWMRVGFIHGVMNTDNTAISGETIDFGPCAMMNTYHPDTVFSSIDRQGRYAFGNQPPIVLWNMARLAESLLPLMADDPKDAVPLAEQVLNQYGRQFEQAYFAMLANKLGLPALAQNNSDLLLAFLQTLQDQQLDYTQTFVQLGQSINDESVAASLTSKLGDTYANWRSQLGSAPQDLLAAKTLLQKTNPLVIPRNHHVEQVLANCEETGSPAAAEAFLKVLRSPYEQTPTTADYQDVPADNDEGYRTFCGT